MKSISLYSFIHTIFIISIISILSAFIIFIQLDHEKEMKNQEDRYNLIANNIFTILYTHPNNYKIENISKQLHLLPLNNIKKLDILNNGTMIFKKETRYSRVRVFTFNKFNYIYIQTIGYNLMFKLNQKQHYNIYIAITIILFVLSVIIFVYISILKKLKPLKTLYKGIEQFKQGDLSINIKSISDDEIGKITVSFNEAINNIKNLLESKNLFMRSIIHELKTPITKGLFLISILKIENDDKKQLEKVFYTLNDIITQLANIEKIKNLYLQIPKEQINIHDILNNIIDILHIQSKEIDIDIKTSTYTVNKELFFTLLKNLIENGIKYKEPNSKLLIKLEKSYITISSKGKPLEKPLEYYIQPFIQEKKNSQGFGLGLYIVNEIVKLHNFKLEYNHKNGFNSFSIKLKFAKI